MVRLIHINIPQAVMKCLDLAGKIELHLRKIPKGSRFNDHRAVMRGHADHYLRLAEDIEGLKYLSEESVRSLVRSHSFLEECVR